MQHHNISLLRLKNVAILLILLLCFYSCSKTRDSYDIISNLLGSEITIPSDYTYQIIDKQIDFDFDDYDFKIITYIDSSECTSCMMKLHKWESIINELKSVNKDASIGFIMILDSESTFESKNALSNELFHYPIVHDAKHSFSNANSLIPDNSYHTFLLDSDNRILAVGNPTQNPRIKELFKKIIVGMSELQNHIVRRNIQADTTIAFGVISSSESISLSTQLANTYTKTLHILDIIPSCNCIDATVSCDSILPHGYVELNIIVNPSREMSGTNYQQSIEVFYQEHENPKTIIINGFINN